MSTTAPPPDSVDDTATSAGSEPRDEVQAEPGEAPQDEVDPAPASLSDRQELQRLRDTVGALEARLKKVSAAYKAQLEEVEATKERLQRQSAYKEERRRGEVVGTLFEPVENLRRSIGVVQKELGEEAAKGLELVHQQFMEAFKGLGLEEVPGRGARFDPNLHEALTMMPVTDPALDGIVVEVFDKGYRIGSNLLKPSRVIVGQLQDVPGEA